MDISRRHFFRQRQSSASPFRPPWSLPEAQFVDRCSRCDDCLKACPTGLLKRGDGGFPIADFGQAACTFCADCVQACASGALAAGPLAWDFTIEISEACLAQQRVECRVCGEVCAAGAIAFRPRLGGMALPAVDSLACTACGACLSPCPTGAIARIVRNELIARPDHLFSLEVA